MRISILTPDSKLPNLAAMKISAYHKARGDKVMLNMPLWPCDKTYVSILFDWTSFDGEVNRGYYVGGPGRDPSIRLPEEIDTCRPDYDLYDMNYSLGFTYRACHRGCDFCKVGEMNEPTDHRSIWTFHDKRFDTIALLNNNTFEDPRWHETFEEIWAAGLKVKDFNGYDLRLIDRKRALALARTRWEGQVHFAWDSINDEKAVLSGLAEVIKWGLQPWKIACYVLIGYDSTPEEDLYRVEKLRALKVSPFVMPFDKNEEYQRRFARWVNRKAIFKSVPWSEYRG